MDAPAEAASLAHNGSILDGCLFHRDTHLSLGLRMGNPLAVGRYLGAVHWCWLYALASGARLNEDLGNSAAVLTVSPAIRKQSRNARKVPIAVVRQNQLSTGCSYRNPRFQGTTGRHLSLSRLL